MMGSYSKKLPSSGVWASVHGNLTCAHITFFKKVVFVVILLYDLCAIPVPILEFYNVLYTLVQ